MKKKKQTAALLLGLLLGVQLVPYQELWAAEQHEQETDALLAEAVADMEEGAYAEGEALISIETTQAAALTTEGIYRYDRAVQIEEVRSFGEDTESGRDTYIVHLRSDKYTTEELMELALDQYGVDAVSANSYRHLMAADPYADSQWHLDGAGADSRGIRFSEQKVTAKETPVIAVIDTGVDYTHPDLADSMWVNPYPAQLSGTYGYDFADDDTDPMDKNGHGTHVSGIAAASQQNGIGITGASAAKIMALKVVEDGSTDITDAAIIAAYGYIYDAMEAGVSVRAVNCSWGGSYDTNGMLARAINAVGKLGALSVFAAGNDGTDWDWVSQKLATPYDLNSPYVVIVGASDEDDAAAEFSDYSASYVDLFAPGCGILSTYNEPMYLPELYSDAQRAALSVYYNTCSASDQNILPADQTWDCFYTAQQLGIASDYSVSVQQMKDGADGYLKLTVTRERVSGSGEIAGSIYVDVTGLQLDRAATYYVAFSDGAESGSHMDWEAAMMTSTAEKSRFVERDGRTYLRIVGLDIDESQIGRKMYLYLDDLAISVANADEASFGAYQYCSGTSMSTPIVSAAVATLAAANPTLSAKAVRAQLLKSVRSVSGLKGLCVTGGIIDFSKLKTLATKVTLNKKSATVHYGKKLTLKAKVAPTYVTTAKVKWKSSNTKYATVNSKGVVTMKKAGIGHTVKITATTTDGSKKSATCRIRLKK